MCGDVAGCCGGNIKSNMTYTTATRNNSANLGYVAASSINFQFPPTVGGWKLMVLLEKTDVGKKEERRRLVQEPGGGSRERMIFKQQTNKQTPLVMTMLRTWTTREGGGGGEMVRAQEMRRD